MSGGIAPAVASRMAVLSRTWERLNPRERWLVAFTLALVVLAALWSFGLAPALRVARMAPQQLDVLASQLQTMQMLAAEAGSIQSRPPMARDHAVRALDAAVRQRLGASTQLRVAGDRATVVLQGVAPDVLAQWLSQVRTASRVVPSQLQLRRGATGWEGTIVLELPPA